MIKQKLKSKSIGDMGSGMGFLSTSSATSAQNSPIRASSKPAEPGFKSLLEGQVPGGGRGWTSPTEGMFSLKGWLICKEGKKSSKRVKHRILGLILFQLPSKENWEEREFLDVLIASALQMLGLAAAQ